MISRWKKKLKKPSFSRAISLKLLIFELKVENFYHQILKNSVFAAKSSNVIIKEIQICLMVGTLVHGRVRLPGSFQSLSPGGLKYTV